MSTRWTEDDLTRFVRNSGRGLPQPTLQSIANRLQEPVDANGDPVPKKTKTKAAAPKKDSPNPSKYHAEATVMDGIRFDSQLEANYYTQLEFERKSGGVLYFLRQVSFPLPGGVTYRLDFLVVRPSQYAHLFNMDYIDCKGFETQAGKNKIKMVQALYGIRIELVKKARKLRSR